MEGEKRLETKGYSVVVHIRGFFFFFNRKRTLASTTLYSVGGEVGVSSLFSGECSSTFASSHTHTKGVWSLDWGLQDVRIRVGVKTETRKVWVYLGRLSLVLSPLQRQEDT